MSKRVKILLVLSGLLILPSWGFRLYILYLKWNVDPFRVPTLIVSVISVFIGVFLIWMAMKGERAGRRAYTHLILAALFTVGFWGYRLLGLILHPERDPNPRAHLRLSATFLILGGVLLATGWLGRQRRPIEGGF